jgi:hypothetical protein
MHYYQGVAFAGSRQIHFTKKVIEALLLEDEIFKLNLFIFSHTCGAD